jgi:spore coat polysaccharide biosynthesis protein SpsF
MLEVGASVGRNIRALQRMTTADLYGLEPNGAACERLREILPPERVLETDVYDITLDAGAVELAFTFGVLIHVPEERLQQAMNEIERVASRWILAIEYFAPSPQAVSYHGRPDMLWKRDYGSLWLDRGLAHIANGFFWSRTTGQDNVNWWLFSKQDG